MPLTVSAILRHPDIHNEVRLLARDLLKINERHPRLASVFATEQRSMMGNIAFRVYFASVPELPRHGILLARFLDEVEASGVASRNTADGFIKEMTKYGYARQFDIPGNKRIRPYEPTETTIGVLIEWAMAHVATLDRLDSGNRVASVTGDLDTVSRLHVELSRDLLGDGSEAQYSRTLALFAWVNNSKLLNGRLLGGMGDVAPGATRVSTDIDSIAELASFLNISRTHLTRKIREVEAIGSIFWEGRRGLSPMWISTGFVQELIDECAARLAIFDAAYKVLFGNRGGHKNRE